MARTRDQDACPGALQVHQAADGALARIRLPGGMIGPAQLEALAHAATRFGSPAMELTSRGNIQIRGIRGDEATAPWPTPSRRRACCRRPPTSGCAISSPRRCRAASAATPTSATGCTGWTPRSAPSPRWPRCPAGSGSASMTAAATSPASAPTSALTCPAIRSPCCWPAATPASGSHRPTSCPR